MAKGDIWLIELGKDIGHEQDGKRPAIVIGCVTGTLVVVIPITSNLDRLNFPFTELIRPNATNSLDADSVALVFQMRAIDQRRLVKKIGSLGSRDMEKIDALIAGLLQLPINT